MKEMPFLGGGGKQVCILKAKRGKKKQKEIRKTPKINKEGIGQGKGMRKQNPHRKPVKREKIDDKSKLPLEMFHVVLFSKQKQRKIQHE